MKILVWGIGDPRLKVLNRSFILIYLIGMFRISQDVENFDAFKLSLCTKDLFETKLKKCAYLKPISSHFFANYMIVFHKTEVQKIILRCLMGLNSNWFNSYDTKHIYFHFRIFAILYKNTHLSFLCFCVLCHNFCTN